MNTNSYKKWKRKTISLNPSKGFTLIEIMVAMSILLILGSIAVLCYFKFLDRARETVCESNLKGLHNAVLEYYNENEALPASLGDLKLEHIRHGYGLAAKTAEWKTKWAHSLINLGIGSEAHAFSLSYEDLKYYGVSQKMFRCPMDGNGGASYAINANIAGLKFEDLKSGEILIAESDSYTFSDTRKLKCRHGSKKGHWPSHWKARP